MVNRTFLKLKKTLLKYNIVKSIKAVKTKYFLRESYRFIPDELEVAEKVILYWPSEIKKPLVGLVKDYANFLFIPQNAYWPRYERYLKYNNIPYEFFDIRNSTWLEEAGKFDMIVWPLEDDPPIHYAARTKIHILEKYFGKACLPRYYEAWSYEDKIRQYYLYKIYGIPHIDTFVSNNREEASDFIKNARFPLVTKIANGSGSLGVRLLKNKRQAKSLINKAFTCGSNTYWTFLKQKDYVYFQEYIDDAEFDLRVIAVDNKFMGYYRLRPINDFRASGAGLYVKKEIPKEALLIAQKAKEAMGSTILAVDMIRSEKTQEFKVIETSIFISVETAEQLKVNGIPGYYSYENGDFVFRTGKYWIQELAIDAAFRRYIDQYSEKFSNSNSLAE